MNNAQDYQVAIETALKLHWKLTIDEKKVCIPGYDSDKMLMRFVAFVEVTDIVECYTIKDYVEATLVGDLPRITNLKEAMEYVEDWFDSETEFYHLHILMHDFYGITDNHK